MNNTQEFLWQPVSILQGVGQVLQEKLNKLGIYTIMDVIFHLPTKYVDKTRLTPLDTIRVGDLVLVQGNITKVDVIRARRKMLIVTITDGNGFISMRFFHFNEGQKQALKEGVVFRGYGEVRQGAKGYEIIHPEYQLEPGNNNEVADTLTPIYPLTKGVPQKLLQSISEQALALLEKSAQLQEILPKDICQKYNLLPVTKALQQIHRPLPNVPITALEDTKHPAKYRLIFEELLAYQLLMRKIRKAKQKKQALSVSLNNKLQNKFINSLGFTLTKAQDKAIGQILNDLKKPYPMMRLLQGDVGSGKTVVAAIAAMSLANNGIQVAMMVPTEILAEQHYKKFVAWFSELDISVSLLTGKLGAEQKRTALNNIANGLVSIVIGTHALFQNEVEFNNLGLVIVDEQHRFGVEQRLALLNKSSVDIEPHQLIMSATPIPRTVAMTLYADLDLTIIDELPAGRKPVQTVVLSSERRLEVIKKIEHILESNSQVYWVCPLIEESEKITCQAAEKTYQYLLEHLPKYQIGLVHGRMKNNEKDAVITDFNDGKINLLVATTVVEVGVDVPNASLMIIENAERLGLSQLHQLRGRVGRGDSAAYCILLYQAPLSNQSKQRLEIIRSTSDGFEIARRDVGMRGIGDMFGTNQTGINNMRIANVIRDHKFIEEISIVADNLLENYPTKAEQIIHRWLPRQEQYAAA